jgi:hypothetical protein
VSGLLQVPTDMERSFLLFGRSLHAEEFFSFGARTQPEPAASLLRSVDHPQLHTHTTGLLWRSDQLVAETASDTAHKMCKRGTSMASAGFEPAIPLIVAAAHLRLRPHGHQDRPLKNYSTVKLSTDYEILRMAM